MPRGTRKATAAIPPGGEVFGIDGPRCFTAGISSTTWDEEAGALAEGRLGWPSLAATVERLYLTVLEAADPRVVFP